MDNENGNKTTDKVDKEKEAGSMDNATDTDKLESGSVEKVSSSLQNLEVLGDSSDKDEQSEEVVDAVADTDAEKKETKETPRDLKVTKTEETETQKDESIEKIENKEEDEQAEVGKDAHEETEEPEEAEEEEEEFPTDEPVKHENWYVFLVYIIFSMMIFYPVFFYMRTRVWGMLGIEDLNESFHLYWWWKKYVVFLVEKVHFAGGFRLSAVIPFFKDFFAYPILKDMGNFTDFMFNYLLEIFLPFPIWYNVKSIFIFLLNGFCFYLLARYLFRNRLVSILTGFFFATTPYILLHFTYGRIEQIFLFPMPLCILYFLKTISEKKNKLTNSVLCGVFLALISLFYWFYGIFIAFLLGILFLYALIKGYRRKFIYRGLAYLFLSAIVFSIIIAPFMYPYYQRLVVEEKSIRWVRSAKGFPEFDPSRFGTDKTNIPGIIEASCSIEYPFIPVKDQYIPIILTLLVVYAFIRIKKFPGVWHFSFLFFYLLTLGPIFHLGHRMLGVRSWIYITFFKYVPFFNRLSWPSRIVSVVVLIACVLAGYSLLDINRFLDRKSKKLKYVFGGAVLVIYMGLVSMMGLFPIQTTPFHIPDFYITLKPGGIIELPFNAKRSEKITFHRELEYEDREFEHWNKYLDSRYYYHFEERAVINYYQVFHHRKIFNDTLYMGGDPREMDTILSTAPLSSSNSVIEYFMKLSENPEYNGSFRKEDLEYLRKKNYKYLVVHALFFKELLDYAIVNWNRSILSNHLRQDYPLKWYCPSLDNYPKVMYQKYIKTLEEKFGPPIAVDYEINWEWKTLDPHHMKGRWIDNFHMVKTPVIVFRLQSRQIEKAESE